MAIQETDKEAARMDRELGRAEIVDTTRRPSIVGASLALAAVVGLLLLFSLMA